MKTEAVAYAHTCDRAERILFTALQLPSTAGEDRPKARHRCSPYHIPAAKEPSAAFCTGTPSSSPVHEVRQKQIVHKFSRLVVHDQSLFGGLDFTGIRDCQWTDRDTSWLPRRAISRDHQGRTVFGGIRSSKLHYEFNQSDATSVSVSNDSPRTGSQTSSICCE